VVEFEIYMKKAIIFCLVCVVSGCDLKDRVQNTKALAEEMSNMKIKRVTNEQVVTIVDNWGQKIIKKAEKQLTFALSKQPNQSARLCQLQNLPPIDSLAKLYGATITLLTANDLQNSKLSAKEKEVLDAYLYNSENKLPQISNIQKLGDSVLIYNSPVPVNNLICETCALKKTTPLVVWSVRFLRREIIRKVDAKSLLKMKK
jgi:hypothetical protein